MGGVAVREIEADWEALWAPYDDATYRSVLEHIGTEDFVLDIGAGDLRLARRIVAKCRKVYAIEIQEELINTAFTDANNQPSEKLVVIQGDATLLPFPQDVTVGVLLMRHCTHFQLYANKLREAGAERLITNARWRMGVEVVQLGTVRIPYQELTLGWYACWCGKVGFKPGSVDRLITEIINVTHEVDGCPHCLGLDDV
jgi:hypothetical protein